MMVCLARNADHAESIAEDDADRGRVPMFEVKEHFREHPLHRSQRVPIRPLAQDGKDSKASRAYAGLKEVYEDGRLGTGERRHVATDDVECGR